jgi:hypothetical protein
MNFDDIIRNAVAPAVDRAAAAIAKAIAEATDKSISRELGRSQKRASRARRGRVTAARPRRRIEMTAWSADRRARRVPTFVIEATGLDTKKKIVAKFGEGATFHKGKPLPAPNQNSNGRSPGPAATGPARRVVAKPPRIRKAAAAAPSA